MSQNMVQKQANQRLLKKKYETKRVLDPTMEPGSPDKVAKGENGEKQQQHQLQLIH